MLDHIALLYLAVKREGSYTDWDFSRSLFFLTAGLMSLRGNRSAEYNHQSHVTMLSHMTRSSAADLLAFMRSSTV